VNQVLIERRAESDGVAILRLADPDNGNRLGRELAADLVAALDALAADPELKVLILAGAPNVFSGGASIEVLEALSARQSRIEVVLPRALLGFPVPIVAAVEGDAVGGGLLIALYSDVVIAAEERRYGLNFTSLGFTPGGGATRFLPEIVGPFFAAEMLLTGRLYRGRDLAGRGLFNDILPGPEVFPRALDVAIRIADRPRDVLAMTKRALSARRLAAFEEAASIEQAMHEVCFSNPRTIELVRESHFT
jgi:4-carboxy-3-alkylbut-2-enoyl-[acp] decarboxylase